MTLLRFYLFAALAVIVIYTGQVILTDGFDLVTPFFGDMAAMTWPGQFNLDFMTFLLLSALWVAWRHQFSPAGLALAAIASVGGMLFLSIYLLINSFRPNATIETLLLGESQANT